MTCQYYIQEILLDCDQSNVLHERIIFFCILLCAVLFLLTCIRDLTSILPLPDQ